MIYNCPSSKFAHFNLQQVIGFPILQLMMTSNTQWLFKPIRYNPKHLRQTERIGRHGEPFVVVSLMIARFLNKYTNFQSGHFVLLSPENDKSMNVLLRAYIDPSVDIVTKDQDPEVHTLEKILTIL
jgi:hypothetical protein